MAATVKYSLCFGLEQELKTTWSLVAESCVTIIILLTLSRLYLSVCALFQYHLVAEFTTGYVPELLIFV